MALKTLVSKGKKILKGLKGDKRTKVGRTLESAKTKVKEAVAPKKSTVKPQPVKPQPVKPMTKAEKIAIGGAGAGTAGIIGSALLSKDKKAEVKKPVVKKTTPKKEETKTYQDAKLNKSNAPMPDFTPKKETKTDMVDVAPKKEEFDRMQAARDQMKRARESMGMGSRFGYKKGGSVKRNMRDGCAVRGKTKGKLI